MPAGEPVDPDAHRLEFQPGDPLVDLLGHVVDLDGQLARVGDGVLCGQRLRGERHVHHAGGVSLGAGEVDKAPLAENEEAFSAPEDILIHASAHAAVDPAGKGLEGVEIQLDVEVPAVANDRAVLHQLEMRRVYDVDIAADGDEQVADLRGLSYRHHAETVHDGLQGTDRIDLADDHVRPRPAGPSRYPPPAPAVTDHHDVLARKQDVRCANDAVDRALPRAVAVVEQVLGGRVVHRDDRELQHAGIGHRAKANHAGGRFLHRGRDRPAVARELPVQGVHQVRAIVHRDRRLVPARGRDMIVIGLAVLALDCEGLDAEVPDQTGGYVVLRRQRVGRAEHQVGPAGLQRPAEVGGFGGHVQARAHSPALQRLVPGEPLAHLAQDGHVVIRPQNPPLALIRQREVLHVVLCCLGHLRCIPFVRCLAAAVGLSRLRRATARSCCEVRVPRGSRE